MKFFKLLLFLLLLTCCFISLPAYSLPFDKMIVFGNSLTDNGNLYKLTLHFIPKSPPYYNGRLTNGPVWADDLAAMYHLDADHFHDYAMAGSTATLHLNPLGLPYTFKMQIGNYLMSSIFSNRSKTLFIIWVGEGDYLLNYKNLNVEDTIHDTVDSIIDGIKLLIAHNAKYFLILNLPDLGKTPKALANEKLAKDATALVTEHNNYLTQQIKALQSSNPDIKIMLYDVYKDFEEGIKNPGKYGFTNIKDACYTGGYTEQELLEQLYKNDEFKSLSESQQNIILHSASLRELVLTAEAYKLRLKSGLSAYPDCSGYLFWDKVHPTKEVHQILANKLYIILNQNGFVLQ